LLFVVELEGTLVTAIVPVVVLGSDPVVVVVVVLGLRNENEAREWFRSHPDTHVEFELMNQELQQKINELQERAKIGLQNIVVKERQDYISFLNKNIDVNLDTDTIIKTE
jgi:hypothetical protein